MKSSMLKWMIRTTFVILGFVSTASAQAQTANHEQSRPLGDVHLQQLASAPAKFRLQFSNAAQAKVVLTITDTEGNTLLHKKIEQASFAQTFDLSGLKDGAYTFTLQKGKEVVKKTVLLNTDYVMVKKAYIK